MRSIVVERLRDVPPEQWNRLAGRDNPFVRHEFLCALEETGCVSPQTGWQPCHVWLTDQDGRPIGAVPLYLKSHSWGEYVFDWAWAEAYTRAGLEYYPKLLAAIPFTPATGPRLLVSNKNGDRQNTTAELIRAVHQVANQHRVSSIHFLFPTEQDCDALTRAGWMTRLGNQFHWSNAGYRNFDDFLSQLSSAKRKKIRRERSRVRSLVDVDVLPAGQITEQDWLRFYRFYCNTIERHGAIAYLSAEFFAELGKRMPEKTVMITARRAGRLIAAALCLRGANTLYGRYWGCAERVPDLHFEMCCYRPVEYCIQEGLATFEAGAQGEHKLSRGLLPATTRSMHWIRHAEFARAIGDAIARETRGVTDYARVLDAHSPFRNAHQGHA